MEAKTQAAPASAVQTIMVPVQLPGASTSHPLVVQVTSLPSSPPPDPHWTAYLQAIGTPVVAVIAACIAASIAFRQWQTAQNKLKLDLFERRYEVYVALTQLMGLMVQEKWVEQDVPRQLMAKTGGTEFLFDHHIYEYVVEVVFKHVNNRMSLQYKAEIARRADNQALFAELSKELALEREWFDNEIDELRKRMRPFLQLKH